MPCVMECPVVVLKEVAPSHCLLTVRAPEIAREARPGQFAMLLVADGLAPFLRRPFSFSRIYQDSVGFLIKVGGQGTRLLAQCQPGQTISVQGPLGNGFNIDPARERHIIVAGGMGVAPCPALAEGLVRVCGKAPEVIIGARTADLILCERDFREMGCTVHIVTDDGSAGEKGAAAHILDHLSPQKGDMIYACGPMPMLASISLVAEARGVDCQVSLEANMACGDGACLGCVVESRYETEGEKMVRVCKDGPVFDSKVIDWTIHNLAYDPAMDKGR